MITLEEYIDRFEDFTEGDLDIQIFCLAYYHFIIKDERYINHWLKEKYFFTVRNIFDDFNQLNIEFNYHQILESLRYHSFLHPVDWYYVGGSFTPGDTDKTQDEYVLTERWYKKLKKMFAKTKIYDED